MEQTMLEIPVSVVIGFVGALLVAISTMAGTVYKLLLSRLKAQDMLIHGQGETIRRLQDDVDRLVMGCGHRDCHWNQRKPNTSGALHGG